MNPSLPRREFLRTSTALIALPFLDSLGFRRLASAASRDRASARPKRMIFLGFGWGVTQESWYPSMEEKGRNYQLPAGLEPLAAHRNDFTIVQGLQNRYTNNGHYGSTFWLTGANEFGEPGQSFHNSISVDQVAAAHLGQETRFDSLVLDCGAAARPSGHGLGLSLSWDRSGKPMSGPKNPVEAFHRLFAKDTTPMEQQQAMLAQRRSVLDQALENARELQRGLSKTDKDKLDEYFQGIRDIETRLSREEKWLGVPRPVPPISEPKPDLLGYEEIQLMYDIMLAAFQTDSTRVVTYRQPVSTLLTSLEVRIDAHTMSHYPGKGPEYLEASEKRDQAQSRLLAHLLGKLKAAREPDGSSLFDHTTVVYGSNIRTGHLLDNCPTLIAGRGAGVKLGQNVVVPKDTPLCNAWLALLQGSGVSVDRHGDSTGVLKELLA
ncbi:MAG: hypothetical protein RLZZ244_2263 [Verrucomicrobiota bacterium]|jgi:hypothetical protein